MLGRKTSYQIVLDLHFETCTLRPVLQVPAQYALKSVFVAPESTSTVIPGR